MLRTKKADRIVCIATVVMLLGAACLWGLVEPVRGDGSHTIGYENLLFDKSQVHTIDITMENWDAFIQNATAEEYTECNIAVDGEKFNNVAIRAKGNTSLSSVSSLGSTRYSFKVEFNHYVKGMTYHGLDKLSLNNLIQDATMMKDYLAYTLMGRMNVPSSQCSYVQINVNGEPWGLYLAVEGVEDSFMDRNSMTKGELYKPDSLSFGGGRGNGRGFDMEQFRVKDEDEETTDTQNTETPNVEATAAPANDGGFGGSAGGQMPQGDFGASSGDSAQQDGTAQGDFGASTGGQMPQGDFGASSGDSAASKPDGTESESGETEARKAPDFSGMQGGGFGGFNFGMGSEDVKLIYSDDDPSSYSNIFNNAKTKIKEKDKTRLIESLKKLNAKEDLDSVVNKDEVIRYLAVHNFLCNDDSYTGMMVHNYYLYEEKGKLSIIPWDYNLGFGGFSSSGNATSAVNSPIDSPVSGGTVDSRPLIAWIFSNEEALAAYHEAYDRFIAESVESGWLAEEIARVKDMITPYLEKDASAFYDMEAFEKGVSTLQAFCARRGESVRGQLEGTVPSTSQDQRGSAALIDASDISTADMGSMNGGGGPGNGGPGNGGPGGGMPSGMPDFSGQQGGVTPPEGFPQVPGREENDSFGGSAGSSGESAQAAGTPAAQSAQPAGQPESTVSASPQASGRPGDAASASPQASGQPNGQPNGQSGRPGGFPGGDFPGAQQDNAAGQWIQLALCAAVLLAAVLIVRRIRSHNG